MKRYDDRNFLTGPALVYVAVALIGCATSRPPEPVMPPSLPEQEVVPPTVEPVSEPTSAETLSIPDGVSLFLDGTSVGLNSLPPLNPELPSQTVRIQASPSAPYRNVERILERLHDLGYFIDFIPMDTP